MGHSSVYVEPSTIARHRLYIHNTTRLSTQSHDGKHPPYNTNNSLYYHSGTCAAGRRDAAAGCSGHSPPMGEEGIDDPVCSLLPADLENGGEGRDNVYCCTMDRLVDATNSPVLGSRCPVVLSWLTPSNDGRALPTSSYSYHGPASGSVSVSYDRLLSRLLTSAPGALVASGEGRIG
jgi:hypothetical protein